MELEQDLIWIDEQKRQKLFREYQYQQQGTYKNFSDFVRQKAALLDNE